jgi:hypothetical protein
LFYLIHFEYKHSDSNLTFFFFRGGYLATYIALHNQFSIHLYSSSNPSSLLRLLILLHPSQLYFLTLILVFPRVFFQPNSVPAPFLVESSGSELNAQPSPLIRLYYVVLISWNSVLSSPLSCDVIFHWTEHFS